MDELEVESGENGEELSKQSVVAAGHFRARARTRAIERQPEQLPAALSRRNDWIHRLLEPHRAVVVTLHLQRNRTP